jgi:peptidyl-prolyl cis-trans isomerase SurA
MNTSNAMHHISSPVGTGKPVAYLSALLLCAALGAAPNLWAQANTTPPRAQPADSIVAIVNSDVITRNELEERMRTVEQRMRQQGVALPPPDQLRRQLLERLIVDRAQIELAKEMGIRVDDTMLDMAVARIAESNKMSVQQFRNQLEHEGVTFAKFREEIRGEIMMQRVREQEVDNKIQVPESEVDNYLAAEADVAANQQELDIAQILIRVPESASPEQIAKSRQRAEDVMQKIRASGNFAQLAATYSDSSDALSGGDLGWRNRDRLPQLFVDAVASLNQGDVSQIVKSANGFHILKLVGKRTPSVLKGGSAAPGVTQTHARHILIKVNQVVTAADARRKLLDLKQRIENKSATFEELAKLYSNDGSAAKGGDLGWLYAGDTVPEFERAMDALQPGQISEPVESQFGYHLIQVLERKTEDVSKERKRMAARQAIRERKLEEATEDWLRQIRDRAYVEIRLDDANK